MTRSGPTPNLQLDHQKLLRLIKSRRTIHDFLPEVPPIEDIKEAIEHAHWAPNHKLTEPWRFRLIGEQTKAAIVDLNTELVYANKGEEAARLKHTRWSQVPGWLVVSSIKCDDPVRSQENYASVCCAIQNFSLILWNQRIGLKWTTGPVTREEKFYELVNISSDLETVVGLLWYGFPTKVPERHRGDLSNVLLELD